MNLEQEVIDDLGVFARAGFASGDVEPIHILILTARSRRGCRSPGSDGDDRTIHLDSQPLPTRLLPFMKQFLNEGGLGILIGDGQLPHPGLEQIIETYYQFPINAWKVMFDYQFVVNPAYNRDRGPVSVGGIRVHSEF